MISLSCGGLTLHCATSALSDRITYLLYPMDVLELWLPQAAEKYHTSIVCVTGIDWDNALSPWPAPGEPPGSPDFKGRAPEFLDMLISHVVPMAEKALGCKPNPDRALVGVSMSGLFALWQRFVSSFFPTVASLSGSFWYPGFADWVEKQTPVVAGGAVYMLLGDKESRSPIVAFQSVATDTQKVLRRLQQLGIKTEFESVPGNHFAHPLPRLNKAFDWLAALPD